MKQGSHVGADGWMGCQAKL